MTDNQGATRTIARFAVDATWQALPDDVRRHALCSFVNFFGCAIGGSQDHAVTIAQSALSDTSGPPRATVIGRGQRQDRSLASLLNGLSASVHAFDDTHADTVVHPSTPVAAAALATAEAAGRPVSGVDLLLAFALGIEFTCRLSKAISTLPARGPLGWSQTGITASIGAAIACGKIVSLDDRRLAWAIGIATSQTSGIRVAHGSMTMHLIPAHAAATGVRAAMFAQQGFESTDNALEGRNGFLSLYATEASVSALAGDLGVRHELLGNTFKPYPCGIVINPVVDGCLSLKLQHNVAPEDIRDIELHVHPTAIALADRRHPSSTFEAQVSLHHWASIALAQGAAGIRQGSLEAINDPAIVALRDRCRATGDAAIGPDAAEVRVTLGDGHVLRRKVERCRGSASSPLTDADISAKFLAQAEGIFAPDHAGRLLDCCWNLPHAADIGTLCELARMTDAPPR